MLTCKFTLIIRCPITFSDVLYSNDTSKATSAPVDRETEEYAKVSIKLRHFKHLLFKNKFIIRLIALDKFIAF